MWSTSNTAKAIFLFLFFRYCSFHAQPSAGLHPLSQEILRHLYSFNLITADSLVDSGLKLNANKAENFFYKAYVQWYFMLCQDQKEKSALLCLKFLDVSEKYLSQINNPNQQLFLKLNIILLKGRIYGIIGEEWKAFLNLHKASGYIRTSLSQQPNFPAFSLINGLYLYYRERSAKTKPYLLPYLIWLPTGNESGGLKLLQQAANSKDLVLSCEASYFLMRICLENNNPKNALTWAERLCNLFPDNLLFQYYRIVAMCQLNQHAKAREFISKLTAKTSTNYPKEMEAEKSYLLQKMIEISK